MIQALLELFGGIFAFAGHITGGSSFPEPLSPEEEKDCIARLEAGDAEARRLLIEHNLRLVAHIAKKYTTPKRDADDVISIGVVGLIKAVSTFNSQKGNTLATYAARCIENEILMYLRKTNPQKMEVSIDDPLNVDWDGNELLLSDILGTDDDTVSVDIESEAEKRMLLEAVEKLDEREKLIMELRFGLNNRPEKTQKEVADMIGISQSYISRLEKRIIKRLKKEMESLCS